MIKEITDWIGKVANSTPEKRSAYVMLGTLVLIGYLFFKMTNNYLDAIQDNENEVQLLVNRYEAKVAEKDAQLVQCNNERVTASIEREKKYFELLIENRELKKKIPDVDYDLDLGEENDSINKSRNGTKN